MIHFKYKNFDRIQLFLFLLLGPLSVLAQEVDQTSLLRDIEYLSSDELAGRKPLTDGNLKAALFIRERFEELGLSSQYKNYTQSFALKADRGAGEKLGNGSNIVGFVPGRESDRIIVITAHYDHLGTNREGMIFNGADDNASGTAALLAMAEHFSRHRPKVSMVFAALDAEEMGLQGARALVRDFPFPLENVLVNINMDMISRSEKNELYAAGTWHHPELKPFLKKASKGNKVKLRFGHDEPGVGNGDWTHASDHAAFHEKGIPFVYFGVEDHEDYHKDTDIFANIDPDFYYEAVRLIMKCVEELDNSYFK
jgi:Zn-dependent M28 family amino/carboxypeptidase